MTQSTSVALLMTGNEITAGDIIDTNSNYLAQQIRSVGLQITEIATVGDDLGLLVTQLQRLRQNYSIVIVNGGLGPTDDDLTAAAFAQAFNRPLIKHTQALAHVHTWCKKLGFEASQANLKQAILPKDCHIFADAPGSAAAFYLHDEQGFIVATPGVPSELKQITEKDILPYLQQHVTHQKAQIVETYNCFGLGESSLQETINKEFAELKEHYNLGFRADFPVMQLKIQAKSTQENPVKQRFLSSIEDCIFASGQTPMAQTLLELLQQQGKTLALAESCTGGLIASQLTSISGASSVFLGSAVTYANSAKSQLLGVSSDTLEQYGAVSQQVALEMLQGCFEQFDCDVAAAITGIAGPSGGTNEKPVGTVWIAFGNKQDMRCVQLRIPFARQAFQSLTATMVMDCIRRQLLQIDTQSRYLERFCVK